jgi:crotonobetainyl-CoA:carnitine CoA-transferase CaiB-like acyl-CoA transferase
MQLSGIRVVDLSRILSGPFCSMFLADMGAEVVKIEDVDDGDPVRRQGVLRNGFSLYFASFNRNKRSLTLDLRSVKARRSCAGSSPLPTSCSTTSARVSWGTWDFRAPSSRPRRRR